MLGSLLAERASQGVSNSLNCFEIFKSPPDMDQPLARSSQMPIHRGCHAGADRSPR